MKSSANTTNNSTSQSLPSTSPTPDATTSPAKQGKKRGVYSPELKQQITELILSGKQTIADVCEKHGIPYQTVYNWINGDGGNGLKKAKYKHFVIEAPLPKGLDFKTATSYAITCAELGFKSTEAGAFCRKKGVYLKELEEFHEWLDSNGGLVPRSLLDTYKSQICERDRGIKDRENTIAELKAFIEELKQANGRQRSALAEYALEMLLRKEQARKKAKAIDHK